MIRFWEKRIKTGTVTENLEFDKELEEIMIFIKLTDLKFSLAKKAK